MSFGDGLSLGCFLTERAACNVSDPIGSVEDGFCLFGYDGVRGQQIEEPLFVSQEAAGMGLSMSFVIGYKNLIG